MTTESNKFPKVTIVTACYNRVATIRETIESVLAQDYEHVEYIIIDGASTDGTQRIVEEYASRLAHFLSEPDHGMYEALNKGLRMATGGIIGGGGGVRPPSAPRKTRGQPAGEETSSY